MVVLALSDGTTLAMWAVNLLVSGAITIVLARVAASTNKLQRVEDDRDRKVAAAEQRLIQAATEREARINAAEAKLHEATTKLIDERFRAMTHEVKTHVQGLTGTLDLLKLQLEDGSKAVGELYDVDHKIELGVASKIDQIKDYIREKAATKDDLKEHERSVSAKFDRQGEQISKLATNVAVLASKVEGGK